jgi:probable HAF family extracellular repeat protein
MWGMVIAIGIVIAIVGSILGDSLSMVTAATQPSYTTKPTYTIKDLGDREKCGSYIYKINNAGQVVGSSRTSNGFCHAFWWYKNKKIDLGTLGGRESYAYGINNAGKVVGVALTSGNVQNAVIWGIDKKIDRSWYGGYVLNIDDADQVVGFANVNGVTHAVLWDAQGRLRDLDISNPSVRSEAYDINNAGQVVGVSNDRRNAVLWDKGKKIDLKTLGGRTNMAFGINNEGKVVGFSESKSGVHAVLWDKDSITTLGSGMAHSINKAGQVVGGSNGISGSAILWEKGLIKYLEYMIPSNSGWRLNLASDINDSGQIVGSGIFKGKAHGFLLTPIK